MDLSKYVGMRVRIDLINGFYYSGICLSADSDSILIKDKNEKLVTIKLESISYIREETK